MSSSSSSAGGEAKGLLWLPCWPAACGQNGSEGTTSDQFMISFREDRACFILLLTAMSALRLSVGCPKAGLAVFFFFPGMTRRSQE